MARRVLFTVTTPLGYQVALSRNRWREIVRFKHPALAGKIEAVRRCLLEPDVVRASSKDPTVHLYYRQEGAAYACVVVASDVSGEFFVVTAYLAGSPKKGQDIWIR